ncbi:MAG: histidine kinase dimerization/phosphoacceptor domain -containing protein [Prochlorotrichaceae cyanobacterium]
MQKPPLPDNEADRLRALERYNILDTLPEQDFDDLTRLAATICDVPIALISLVDQHRQWFKSSVGLQLESTPRDVSFCGHVVALENFLLVPDVTKDDRFADNPLVLQDPKIRFYAGAPLMTPDGYSLGTLCVIDQQPRNLSDRQIQALQALSRQVISQLELRRSLLERAVLLNELHHRVKNNLLMVAGLLDLQMGQITDPLAQQEFEDSQKRIQSIALVHEILYTSNSLTTVDLADYFSSLIQFLWDPHLPPPYLDLESIEVNLETATTSGLLFSELILILLKHGVANHKFSVSMGQESQDTIILTIQPDPLSRLPSSAIEPFLGTPLLKLLSQQLRATLQPDMDRAGKTQLQVFFKNMHYSDRLSSLT